MVEDITSRHKMTICRQKVLAGKLNPDANDMEQDLSLDMLPTEPLSRMYMWGDHAGMYGSYASCETFPAMVQ